MEKEQFDKLISLLEEIKDGIESTTFRLSQIEDAMPVFTSAKDLDDIHEKLEDIDNSSRNRDVLNGIYDVLKLINEKTKQQ